MDRARFRRELGKVIRGRRSRLGYSQESFATEIGLHRTYVGAVERGERNVSIDNLVSIAAGLQTSLSRLSAVAERPTSAP